MAKFAVAKQKTISNHLRERGLCGSASRNDAVLVESFLVSRSGHTSSGGNGENGSGQNGARVPGILLEQEALMAHQPCTDATVIN